MKPDIDAIAEFNRTRQAMIDALSAATMATEQKAYIEVLRLMLERYPMERWLPD